MLRSGFSATGPQRAGGTCRGNWVSCCAQARKVGSQRDANEWCADRRGNAHAPHAAADRVHHRQRRLRALLVLRDAQHPHAVPRLVGAAVRRDRAVPRPSARARPRKSSTPSCWACTSSRCSAAGWPTGSWASTARSSSSAWSTASATPAWPLFESNKAGFYAGLFLIALGSGGIKPCVSAFVGDQFDQTNKSLAKVVFDAFYWIINFGSFFASLLMPLFLRQLRPGGRVRHSRAC